MFQPAKVWISVFGLMALFTVRLVGQQEISTSQDMLSGGAKYFPKSTAIFVEVSNPSSLIEKILEHPLRAEIENLDAVKEALKDADKQLAVALNLIEGKTELEWTELLKLLTEKGVYLGVDVNTGGVALLVHSASEEKLKETAGFVLGLIKSQAGEGEAYKIQEYRGIKVAEFEEGTLARKDDWLLFSNKKALAKKIADNLLDEGEDNLTLNSQFTAASQKQLNQDAWVYIDAKVLRDNNIAQELFSGRTDNAGVELLVGGVLDALNQTSEVVFGSTLKEDHLEFSAAIPFDQAKADANRSFFFGDSGQAYAPVPIKVENPILNVTGFRDLGSWWNHKEELYEENVVAQLALADSQLSTLFAGLSLGDDILGSLKPGFQIVAVPQDYESSYRPDIEIPSMAIIAQLRDPEMERRFRISYNSLVGFINIQLAMDGQMQLESQTEKFDYGTLSSATYLIDDESPSGLIHYNFSPSIAFVDDYFIVSSTKSLAEELMQAINDRSESQSLRDGYTHTSVWLDSAEASSILKSNREALITQNMLEEGNDREEAESQIDTLLKIADYFGIAELKLENKPKSLELNFQVELKNPDK